MTTPYYEDESAPTCECGCGDTPGPGKRFVTRHNLRVLGKKTPEHRARIAEACREAWATKRTRMPLGSRRLDANGYWLVKVVEGAGRWDKEHVLAVEASIGRRLSPGEEVHHINAVKTDNTLTNLLLCSDKSDHAQIHASFDALLPGLIASGAVVFDHEARRYRLG